MGDQDNIAENMFSYVQAFSPPVRDIFECFDFHVQVDRLAKANLLYLVTEKFANVDLHPEVVSNEQMGHVFEELIRKFAELSNETAGEHFTPREVIRLMVNDPGLYQRDGRLVEAIKETHPDTTTHRGKISIPFGAIRIRDLPTSKLKLRVTSACTLTQPEQDKNRTRQVPVCGLYDLQRSRFSCVFLNGNDHD